VKPLHHLFYQDRLGTNTRGKPRFCRLLAEEEIVSAGKQGLSVAMLRHRLATKYDAFVGGLADDTTVDRLCAAMQVRKRGRLLLHVSFSLKTFILPRQA